MQQINRKRVDLIKEIELSPALPSKSIFFDEPVGSKNERNKWFERALDATIKADIVFCDPDKGLASHRAETSNKRSTRHALVREVEKIALRGQSIVLYQFMNRSSAHESQIPNVCRRLKKVIGQSKIWVVSLRRTFVHTYFIIPSIRHSKELSRRLHSFSNGCCKDVLRIKTHLYHC
jgi:hypothetical protein